MQGIRLYCIKLLLILGLVLVSNQYACAEKYSIEGHVLTYRGLKPLQMASIKIVGMERWTFSDEQGHFALPNLAAGQYTIRVSYLGYASTDLLVDLSKNSPALRILMREDNLTLSEVLVTARRTTHSASTTYTIDRKMLDHAQVMDVASISALLPGEQSAYSANLTTNRRFSLRSGDGAEQGNTSLGTAVEVDGVRLETNASMGSLSGVGTRHISTNNIENIEVITGVPSAEHGDLTRGLIRIETYHGRTPWIIDFVTMQSTHQMGLSKGLSLGRKAGLMNLSLERARSTSDPASPYTAYTRNSLTINYKNNLTSKQGQPIELRAGTTLTLGGMDSHSDPDYIYNTYSIGRDNAYRLHANLRWSLGKSYLSSVELGGSLNYRDLLVEEHAYRTAAARIAALHGTQEGYYMPTGSTTETPGEAIGLLPRGEWYEQSFTDSRLLDQALKLRLRQDLRWSALTHQLALGVDYNASRNLGQGLYYADIDLAPDWRPYRYDELPAYHRLSAWLQEELRYRSSIGIFSLQLGLRADKHLVSGTMYKNAHALAPRLNASYRRTFSEGWLRSIQLRLGYGTSYKLPTYAVLYPSTSYADRQVFPSVQAYFIEPLAPHHNDGLRWQHDKLSELGLDLHLKGVRIGLSYYQSESIDPYIGTYHYVPLLYRFTDPSQTNNLSIPQQRRIYSIDRQSGIVTVADSQGLLPSTQLDYAERHTFRTQSSRGNGSPSTRRGLEWVIDIDKITAIQTSFRIDGKYYYYRGVEETIMPYVSAMLMSNQLPSQFIAYYAGSTNSPSNGRLSKELRCNLTATTHIPRLRLVVSLRIEGSLYNYSQRLSEWQGETMGFAVDRSDLSTDLEKDIYAGDGYVASYPIYYSTYSDPTLQPFAERLKWAKNNDSFLYGELYKMIQVTNYSYLFKPNRLSAYWSANISITKELGSVASISFSAKNFLNTLALVKSSANELEQTLFGSGYVPSFYYGLSLKIKL